MEIYNNTISNCYDEGISFGGYDGTNLYENNKFINNIIYNCGQSTRSSNYQMKIYDQTSMSANTFKNNLFYKSGTTDLIYYGNDATNDYPHTVAEFNAENGTDGDAILNNLQIDPLFVDPANSNFHLQINSPAINAGLNVGLPFNGVAPDIGAYEYRSPAKIGFVIGKIGLTNGMIGSN